MSFDQSPYIQRTLQSNTHLANLSIHSWFQLMTKQMNKNSLSAISIYTQIPFALCLCRLHIDTRKILFVFECDVWISLEFKQNNKLAPFYRIWFAHSIEFVVFAAIFTHSIPYIFTRFNTKMFSQLLHMNRSHTNFSLTFTLISWKKFIHIYSHWFSTNLFERFLGEITKIFCDVRFGDSFDSLEISTTKHCFRLNINDSSEWKTYFDIS